MKKTEKLNKLFQIWENSNQSYKGKFIKDGIINESQFEDPQNKKVLFIAKEPNDPKQNAWDFRDWWKDELKYSFSHRIAEWAYGIQHDFPVYKSIWKPEINALNAIHQIAFMNIKKIGGEGTSDIFELKEFLKRDYKFLREEIEIISPKIIILVLSWGELRDRLFPELNRKWEDCGYDIYVAKLKKYKLVDFYHPSSRNAPAAAYSLLQNVIQSTVFQALGTKYS